MPALFRVFDKNGDGTMSYEEFLGEVRGSMSQKRIDLCLLAYEKIDADNDGNMSVEEILKSYDATKHPDVKSGKRSEQNVIVEFMETFEAHHGMYNDGDRNAPITHTQFLDYYTSISSSIESDDVFCNTMN
jgi:Ca2+-binding EF-hand superfamily protein